MTHPEIIPIDVLFGNPSGQAPRSPGRHASRYLAPDEGVLNIWVRTIGDDDAKAVTNDRGRGIQAVPVAFDGRHILYLQDPGGDENWRAAHGRPRDR